MSKPVAVDEGNFDQVVLRAEMPALVDFWAAWCGPCRMVTPIIEELAVEYQGRLKVGSLDVDSNPVTPVQYGVQGIPTCILFKDGREMARIVGVRPKPQFISMVEPHLDSSQ